MLDEINDAATSEIITPRDLAAHLASARVVFGGESHTSIEYHNVQRRLIEELVAAGRRVFVGIEMYPYTEQTSLDKWSAGELTEDAFLKDSRWYKNWGYHWLYYRDIFTFARDHKIRMFGVNTPREVVAAVRKKGFANLTPEEAARIPSRIDTTRLRALCGAWTSEDQRGGRADRWREASPWGMPSRSPGRGPPYWKSRVLRRQALGDGSEDGDHGSMGERAAWPWATRQRNERMRKRGLHRTMAKPANCLGLAPGRLRGEWPDLPTGDRGEPIRAPVPDAGARTDWQIALVSPTPRE